ncbi:MAG TPA: CPBP family intramembrane glutamic endopeptidase [Phycisphaerales bacterium]|nr:CPBP family intramembrane glutamic endopeptidase [Phycisphaerales bacterium]
MTALYPLFGLILAALIAATVAVRLKLFSPPLPAFVPRGPGEGGEIAPPLLLGAFAAYSVSRLLGWGAALVTGRASYGPSVQAPLELEAQTAVLAMLMGMPAVVAIAWWSRRLVIQPFDPSPARIPALGGQAVLWGLVVLPIVFSLGLAARWLSEWLGQPVDSAAHLMLKRIVEPSGDPAWRMCLIASAVIGAPVIEEFCFRALLQRGVMTLTRSAWPAIVFTSALFTVMHVGSIPAGSFWAAATVIFSLSVLLGLLFARTGSVVTVIVVHGMFNAANIAAALYVEWAARTGGP